MNTEPALSDPPPLRDPDRLQDLTRRYARYSLSAGGLGSALGGVLALVTYFIGALATPDGPWGRIALAAAPFLWIGGREALRRGYYQALGRVVEVRTAGERRWHLGFTLFTAAVSLFVVGAIGWRILVQGAPAPDTGQWAYLVLVTALPWLVWRFMPTPLEFIVGVFLVAQAAVILAGGHYELWQQPQVPFVAVVFIAIGVKQHLEFRAIRQELAGAEGR